MPKKGPEGRYYRTYLRLSGPFSGGKYFAAQNFLQVKFFQLVLQILPGQAQQAGCLKPDFNLDIFDISEITSQFLKGTTCRFIVADHCWKSKCYSANAHLFVQSRQEYSIFAVVAALFS